MWLVKNGANMHGNCMRGRKRGGREKEGEFHGKRSGV